MTELHIYPSRTSSRPGLYDYFAGHTTEGYAANARQILSVIRDIQRGRWWSLDQPVKGVATVMALSLSLVILGGLDWVTWAWLLADFGIAGAVTGALYTHDKSKVNAQARRSTESQAFKRRA